MRSLVGVPARSASAASTEFGMLGRPIWRTKLLLWMLAIPLGCSVVSGPAQDLGGEIPERPEHLQFPPLAYEPPDPASWRVTLRAGPVAYVIPDRELPLVNVVILVRVGTFLDPPGQEGLAELTGYLLARGGTETRSADELEERLAFLAALLNSSIGELQGSVSFSCLAKDMDEGLRLLREVLATPRFQEDKLVLRKQQLLQSMKERNDHAAAIEQREVGFLAYGENFWMNRQPTIQSVERIRREDLSRFHRRWFWPSNFVVAASGDFDRADFIARLEDLFAHWPFVGETSPSVPTNGRFAPPGTYLVHKEINQGRVSLLLPGVTRDHPDFFPLLIMNDILGGGGFTSRLVNRVRSDEGLAYAAGSSLPGGVYFAQPFRAAFQAQSRLVPYAISLVLEELRRIRSEPVSEQELHTAQRAFIDTFPRRFATKAQTAQLFAQDELTGRFAKDPNYWKQFRSRIATVSREDVLRVARTHLPLEQLVILIVGNRDEILLGHPDRPVSLFDLSPGPVIDWPLRDPLTLQPLGEPARLNPGRK
ncbi:MAG: pitrilysin family protein [Verrucomicrobiota bacterium]|nr:insulinase family protein [Limisphaera sp.]MDW8381900.1 pitrilysin family protein [Verrucomicrobiota bacterium]